MKINIVRAVLLSNLFLLLRKCLGSRIRIGSFISLINYKANLQTANKGIIHVGYKTAVKPDVELNANGGEIVLSDKCFINRNCVLAAHESIKLGEGTTIGPGTYIFDHDHDGKGGYVTKPIYIGRNVWIGAGCIILKGVTIGDNAVIGAGTLVTKNIPENMVYYNKRRDVLRSYNQ